MLEMPWNRLPWRVRAPFKTKIKNWVGGPFGDFRFSFFKKLKIYTAFFIYFLPCLALFPVFFGKKRRWGRGNNFFVTDHGRVGLLESAA